MFSTLKTTACHVVRLLMDEKLKPCQLSLLCVIAAYEECALTTRQLARMCRMSIGQIHATRQHLLDAGLIHGYKDKRNGRPGPPSWRLQARRKCTRR